MSNAIEKAIAICGSQEALAQKSGLTQPAISYLKTRDRMPRYETAQKLSKAVDGVIPWHEFMENKEVNNGSKDAAGTTSGAGDDSPADTRDEKAIPTQSNEGGTVHVFHP